jgi:hypothetical protein
MRSVQIAELKNRLSAYLQLVRAGGEGDGDIDFEEQSLVATA